MAIDSDLHRMLESFDGFSELPVGLDAALKEPARVVPEVRSFTPRVLVRAALAAASATPVCYKVLRAVCDTVLHADFEVLEPGDLAMFVWALAAANEADLPSLTCVGDQVSTRAWEFTTDELAKVLFAFAELQVAHQDMLATVSMEVMWKVDQFSPWSLAQVAASLARLRYCKEPTFDWVAARVIGRLSDYGREELTTVVWAFAEASIKHEQLALSAATEIARKGIGDDLPRLVWAFGKLQVAPPCIHQPLYHEHLSDPP